MSVEVQRIENLSYVRSSKRKEETEKKCIQDNKENIIHNNLNDTEKAGKQSLISKMVPGQEDLRDNRSNHVVGKGENHKDGDAPARTGISGGSDIADLQAKMDRLQLTPDSSNETPRSAQDDRSNAVDELAHKLKSLGCEDNIPSLGESEVGVDKQGNEEDEFIGRGIPAGGVSTCQQTHVNYDYGHYMYDYDRQVGGKSAAPTDYVQDVKAMRAAGMHLANQANFGTSNMTYGFTATMPTETPQTPDFDSQGVLNMLNMLQTVEPKEPQSIDLAPPVTQFTHTDFNPASRPKLKPKYQFRQEPEGATFGNIPSPVSPESAYGTMSPESRQTSDSPVGSPASEDIYGSPPHHPRQARLEEQCADSPSSAIENCPDDLSALLLSEHALEASAISQVDEEARVDSIEQWLKGHQTDSHSNATPCDDLAAVISTLNLPPGDLAELPPLPSVEQREREENFDLALSYISEDLQKIETTSSEATVPGVPGHSWKPEGDSAPVNRNNPPVVPVTNVPTLSPTNKVSWNGGGIVNGVTTLPQVTLPQSNPTLSPYNVALTHAVTLPSQPLLTSGASGVVLPPNTIMITMPTPSRSGLRPLLPKPAANSCLKMEPQIHMPVTSRVGRGNPLQMAGLDLQLLQKQAIHEMRKNAALDIQTLLEPDEEGDTRLAVAAIYGMVNQVFAELQRLKHANCSEKVINLPSLTGHTPLYYSVSFNYPQIVALLLHFGADPNLQPYSATSRTGLSALHCAAQNGDSHLQTLKVLLASEKLDINLLSKQGGKTAVHVAAEKHGKMKPVEGQPDSIVNSLGIILTLLSNGADLNLKDISSHTALHSIIKTGDVKLLRAVLQYLPPEAARVALRQENSMGNSCLHVLAEVNMTVQDMNAAVNILLEKGADVLHRNKSNQVARDLFHPDHKEVKDLLNRRYRSMKKMENGRS